MNIFKRIFCKTEKRKLRLTIKLCSGKTMRLLSECPELMDNLNQLSEIVLRLDDKAVDNYIEKEFTPVEVLNENRLMQEVDDYEGVHASEDGQSTTIDQQASITMQKASETLDQEFEMTVDEQEVIEIINEENEPKTVRTREYASKPYLTSQIVSQIRIHRGFTHAQFARELGVTTAEVKEVEKGIKAISEEFNNAIYTLLDADNEPEGFMTPQELEQVINTTGLSVNVFAKKIGYSSGYIKSLLSGTQPVTNRFKVAVTNYLNTCERSKND